MVIPVRIQTTTVQLEAQFQVILIFCRLLKGEPCTFEDSKLSLLA